MTTYHAIQSSRNAVASFRLTCAVLLAAMFVLVPPAGLSPSRSYADGMLVSPKSHQEVEHKAQYKGSLEEHSQEAIIAFHSSESGAAREDMVLKITVEGDIDSFAWVVPFPTQPRVTPASVQLFRELFDYVQYRADEQKKKTPQVTRGIPGGAGGMGGSGVGENPPKVEVLNDDVVGSYDIATVRENTPGALNEWLETAGYQRLDGAEDVIEFYRKKEYVFVCIKVSETTLSAKKRVDLHPLHFSFETRGRDGIYFPMKLTGLQKEKFDVNLYVFCKQRLNFDKNVYGCKNLGFNQSYCDEGEGPYDWHRPSQDPFFSTIHKRLHYVASFLGSSNSKERFYLTKLNSGPLDPPKVRKWKDDLWLFPDYADTSFVPFDARPHKVAATGFER